MITKLLMKNLRATGLTCLALSLLVSSDAVAGFKWQPQPMPEAVVMPEEAKQEPIDEQQTVSDEQDIIWEVQTATDSTMMQEPVDTSAIVDGFGSDISLMVALQQIVPDDYDLAVADDVDLSQNVSWNGGRPWMTVLSDVLATVDLEMDAQGQVISILSQDAFVPKMASDEMAPEPQSAPPLPWLADVQAEPMPEPEFAYDQGAFESMEKDVTDMSQASHVQAPVDVAPFANMYEMPKQHETKLAVDAYTPLPLSSPKPETPKMEPMFSDTAPVNANRPGMFEDDIVWGANSKQIVQSKYPQAKDIVWQDTMAKAPTSWNAMSGESLRDVLKTWSAQANVDFHWTIDVDYQLNRALSVEGSYEEAVASAIDVFSEVRPQPYGQLNKTAAGGQSLVIKSYDIN